MIEREMQRSRRENWARTVLGMRQGHLTRSGVDSAFRDALLDPEPGKNTKGWSPVRKVNGERYRELDEAYGVLIEAARRKPKISGDRPARERDPRTNLGCSLLSDMAANHNFVGIKLYLETVFKDDGFMRRFGVHLLESNVERIIDNDRADILIFLNMNTTDDDVYLRTMASMHSRGLREPVIGSLARCKDRKMWDRIAAFAKDMPEKDCFRDYAAQLLEENSCQIVIDRATEAASFLFGNAGSQRVRRIMFEALLAEGDPEALRLMFKRKEEEGAWDWIVGRCRGKPDLEKYAMMILERNVSHVSRHASADTLVFAGTRTECPRVCASMIRSLAERKSLAGVKTVLSDMAEKGLWEELAYAAEKNKGIRRYVAGLMEENLERIAKSGDLHGVAFLYLNSSQEGYCRKLLGSLLKHGKKEEAHLFIDLVAMHGDWMVLMEEAGFAGHPEDIRLRARQYCEKAGTKNPHTERRESLLDDIGYACGVVAGSIARAF